MPNLLNANLTSVKINDKVNSTVTLPGTEKDVEKFLAHEGLNDYLFVEQE